MPSETGGNNGSKVDGFKESQFQCVYVLWFQYHVTMADCVAEDSDIPIVSGYVTPSTMHHFSASTKEKAF